MHINNNMWDFMVATPWGVIGDVNKKARYISQDEYKVLDRNATVDDRYTRIIDKIRKGT